MTGDAVVIVLIHPRRLPHKLNPTRQRSSDATRSCDGNARRIDKRKVEQGENTLAIDHSIPSDKRECFRIAVAVRWDIVAKTIDAAPAMLQPTNFRPIKKLLPMDAKTSSGFYRDDAIIVDCGIINLFVLFNVNMIPYPVPADLK